MEVGKDRFRTIATDGDMRLGGQDWDQRLIDHVSENFKNNCRQIVKLEWSLISFNAGDSLIAFDAIVVNVSD